LRDVSHELRSPLARLRVALELARNRGAGGVEQELDRIELESDRLDGLVGEVLDLLRESSGASRLQLESVDLVELLRDLLEAVGYEAREGQEPALEAEAPITLNADRELLWRTFENLLRNALLHAGGAAPVGVRAEITDRGRWVEVRVLDRGPGVPPERLQHLFDPFYRVQEARDRETGGHGLGLAIAAAAVRRHGGVIEARNRSGGGLEMLVKLPVGGPAAMP
jgi:two-component system sensor histidine kinase CpxA